MDFFVRFLSRCGDDYECIIVASDYESAMQSASVFSDILSQATCYEYIVYVSPVPFDD